MGIDDKLQEMQGKGEKKVGEATNDGDLQAQGERHEAGGKLKDKIDNAIEGVEDKLDKK